MTRATRPLLWPLVPIYRLGLALRELELGAGLKPERRLRFPVASVGSLSTGGAGKTPLAIALAQALIRRSVLADVLSRGYKRRSAQPALVDPRGTTEEFGDEPLVIARETSVPVYVATERYEAGLLAEAGYALPNLKLHLLDDGFQHRQLHRDVDILLLSRNDLNDCLLPAGNLREPLRAAERADVIAIPADEPELEKEIRARGWGAEIWQVRRRMDVPRLDGPVVAFCGIARPRQFFAGIRAAGVPLAECIAFGDHHKYTPRDFERIAAAAQKAKATALLTTEKDLVRLRTMTASLPGWIPWQAVKLRMEIQNEAAAMDWLMGRVRAAE